MQPSALYAGTPYEEMVNRQQFEQETGPEIVTSEEAVQMIELWTREDESGRGVVELRDVTEALDIPDSEGLRLLAQVRKGMTALESVPSVVVPILLTALLLSTLLVSATVVYVKGADFLRGASMSEANWLLLLFAVSWTAAWPLYYRRVLARVLCRYARGFGGFVQRSR